MTHILIVDDSPEDREYLLALVAQHESSSVHAVADGAKAVEYLKGKSTDCVLLDYRLDGEDGISVAQCIRGLDPTMPIIMMTGVERNDLAALSLDSGAVIFVEKPKLTETSIHGLIIEAIQSRDLKAYQNAAANQTTQVLLVEDNADDRENIAWMLEEGAAVSVRSVATGAEALALLDAREPDCVILDYRLETESGVDVLAQFKKRAPLCPVIMLTGQGSEEVAATAIKLGASDYLVKQHLSKTNLATSIQNAISRSALETKVAEQAAERKRFINILVHDLRQPLRNISQIGDMAIEDIEIGDFTGLKHLFSLQMAVASRANHLLETLHEYAMLDGEVVFSTVSLTDVAMAAKENLNIVIAERKAVVEIDDLPTIAGHFPQLVQLFQNLVGNGLKFNQHDVPRVTIASNGLSVAGPLVSVSDNGIGIPSAKLEAVFQPLQRLWTQQDFEGTGLGLAICQKIMERHDGRIWCNSVENKGSSFNMVFPKLEGQWDA